MKKGLTNNYIKHLGEILLGKHFLGVFSCDLLTDALQSILKTVHHHSNVSIVINILPTSYQFGHFVALDINWKNHSYILFDSLNLEFEDKNIQDFLHHLQQQSFNLKGIHPQAQIQNLKSQFCGFFSICFLLSRDCRVGESLESFISRFDTNKPSMYNDKVVIDYIVKFIDTIGIAE